MRANQRKPIYRIEYDTDGRESMPCSSKPTEIVFKMRHLLKLVVKEHEYTLEVRDGSEEETEWFPISFSRRVGRFITPKAIHPELKAKVRRHLKELNDVARLSIIARHVSNNLIPEGLEVDYEDDDSEMGEFGDDDI